MDNSAAIHVARVDANGVVLARVKPAVAAAILLDARARGVAEAGEPRSSQG
jgi:hypothetical protein